jgi:hypothetical protein
MQVMPILPLIATDVPFDDDSVGDLEHDAANAASTRIAQSCFFFIVCFLSSNLNLASITLTGTAKDAKKNEVGQQHLHGELGVLGGSMF